MGIERHRASGGALRIDAVRPNDFDLSALDKLGHLPLTKGRQGCGAADTREGRPYVHPWRRSASLAAGASPALQGAVRWGARCGRVRHEYYCGEFEYTIQKSRLNFMQFDSAQSSQNTVLCDWYKTRI